MADKSTYRKKISAFTSIVDHSYFNKTIVSYGLKVTPLDKSWSA